MTSNDLVVVLPGILGSTLRQDGRVVWGPSGGFAVRAVKSFGRSVNDLKLGKVGDGPAGDGVEPGALMPDLQVLPGVWTPVKGYDMLVRRLNSLGYRERTGEPGAPPGNLLLVPYDWRLSCRYNAERLRDIVPPALDRWRSKGGQYQDAKVVFVCHSMGGLIARWYAEKCGGKEIIDKVVTLGTPYRGAAKALEQLVNGAHPGLGRLRADLTEFIRSMPSMHQLLPEYACVEQGTDLVKTTVAGLPELDTGMVADAMRFHTDLAAAEQQRPESLESLYAIVGVRQSTPTTVRLSHGRAEMSDNYQGQNLFGDATVPVVAASRPDLKLSSNRLRHVPDKHGNLQRNEAALDEVEAILTAMDIIPKAARPIALRVDVPEFALAGEALIVTVTPAEETRHAIHLCVKSEADETGTIEERDLRPATGARTAVIEDLPPGAYTIEAGNDDPGSPFASVTSEVLIWPPEGTTGPDL
jgi:pimeloyl-ACP methyl ester carboxylesterase